MAKITQIRQSESPRILLIEDHHEAYLAWRERHFKKMTLIHMDAHIDFAFQEVKDVPLIFREAKSLSELKSQLEKAVLFRRKQFDMEKLTHIGNYIYPAMRDGIVAEFCWVIPGDIGEFEKCLTIVKRMLKDLWRDDPYPPDVPPLIRRGFIKSRLYGRPLTISVLETLPRIKGPVLLDIDTDFFVIDSLRRAESTVHIGRRRPWIGIEEFIEIVRGKIARRRLTTIAYSVNGGFTPMTYKTLGDRLAKGLGVRDPALEDRLTAGEHFRCFRDALDGKDFQTAGNQYRAALRLNAAYRAPDNNYGPLYFQIENYRRAEKEWRGILRLDHENSHALCGLGKIRLARKKYREAKSYFEAALRRTPDHEDGLLGLARTEFHLKNYRKAETLISTYERLKPMQGYSRYLTGKILEKTKRPQEALAKYKEALQLGTDHVDLLIRLVRLSRRYDRAGLVYLKKRCEDRRKSFLLREKRYLIKKGKMAEAMKTEERFRELFILISA